MEVSGIIRVLKNVPESIKIELGAIADRHRRDYWRIGDITNQIVEFIIENKTKYPDVGELEIYKAVATMLNQEYSARTVRDYASISGFYDIQARKEFDLLPYSHFRYARQFGEQGWKEVLDFSLSLALENNRPPSVEFLEYKFNPPENDDIPEPTDDFDTYEQTADMPEEIDINRAFNIIRINIRGLPEIVQAVADELLAQLETLLQPHIDKLHRMG